MVNILQIVEILSLINLTIPANASIFFNFLINIVEFDIIPT